ncbi:MAG: acyltransferase family protein [Hyphomonas sp.]
MIRPMNRVYTIQYLRALAALAVVALHAGKRVEPSLPDGVSSVLNFGHAGVDLFFVISGFIMWSISRHRSTTAGGFVIRRIIRVAPPFWIAILAWTAVNLILGYSWITITPAHVLQSLSFIPHYSPTFPDRIWPVLVPGWTLNYEMFFYIVFGAALWLPAHLRLRALTIAFVSVVSLSTFSPPTQAWAVTYSSPLLLEFLSGCLIAELWMRRPGGLMRNLGLTLMGIALLAYFGSSVDPSDHWSRTLGFGGPAVLITLGMAGLGAYVRHIPLFEKLGDASYAIYLFHLFVLLPLTEIWIRMPSLHNTTMAFGFIALSLGLASLFGLWLYRHMEYPLQKRLNRLFLAPPQTTQPQDPSLAKR